MAIPRSEFPKRWQNFKIGLAIDLVAALKNRAPGVRLKQSIKYRIVGNTIEISMVGYAVYVEFGTPPHIIRPKNKKALAFARAGGRRVQHADGKVSTEFTYGGKTIQTDAVIVKEVHHPGTRPNPFIRTTFALDFPRIVQKNIERHLI